MTPRKLSTLGGGVALLAAALAVAPFNAAPARAQAAQAKPVRIAVANPARIFNEMQETRSLQARMAEEQKKFVATEREKRAQIEQIKQARDAMKPDHPQYDELNNQLLNASVEYKVWGEAEKARAEGRQKRQMRSLFDKVQAAIAEVAKEEGIDLVIADQRDPLPEDIDQININQLKASILSKDVLYASKESDVSDKVLARLDARFKAAGTGAGAGGGAAAPLVNPTGAGR